MPTYGYRPVKTGAVWNSWVVTNSGTAATTNTTWGIWADSTNSMTVTSSDYFRVRKSDHAWRAWTTSSSITVDNDIWGDWVSATGGTQIVTNYPPVVAPPPETEEQRAERARHRAEAQSRREAVVARANRILQEHLDDEQLKELVEHERFHVMGSRGRRYCIRARGQAGNVDWVGEDGKVHATYCCHPNDVPDPDAWLAQKLALETDEEAFLRVANLHRGNRPLAVAVPAFAA